MKRKTKSRVIKTVVAIVAVAIIVFIALVVFAFYSYTTTDEYSARVKIALNAAFESEGLYVVTSEGEMELDDVSYRRLSYYLTSNPTLALGRGDMADERGITLRIGTDPLRVVPYREKGEQAIVEFTTMDETYRMAVKAFNLWAGIEGAVRPDRYLKEDAQTDEPDELEEPPTTPVH